MKVPHVVPKMIMEAYVPTPEELETIDENDRVNFPSANFDWDAAIIPKLKDLALQQLSLMFHIIQPLTGVLQLDVNALMEILPIDVELTHTVPLIFYEIYWERCCRGKWPEVVYIERPFFGFWKKTYLTMYFEEYLEMTLPENFIIDHSEELATLLSDYITTLNIKQLQMTKMPPYPNCKDGVVRDECIRPDLDIPLSHIPLARALSRLTNLTSCQFVFCIKPMGENLDWRAFRFSIADCELICEGLNSLPRIKSLAINRCELDDIRAKIFFRFILRKPSIEEIDFSHCCLGDEALIALGGLLVESDYVKNVKIRNNIFDEKGCQGLFNACVRGVKAPFIYLDMGMNFLSDEATQHIASALIRSRKKPAEVNMSCCGFKGKTAKMIAGMILLNRSVVKLDITANDFSGEAEEKLLESLEGNRRLLEIDTRETAISEEGIKKIRELLERNKQFIGVDIEKDDPPVPPLYLNDPEYLIWEYNPKNPNHVSGHYPARVAEI